MSKKEKLIKRLLSRPKDFNVDEAETLIGLLGGYKSNRGKTSGSAISFIMSDGTQIELHRPHPGNNLKRYQIDDMIEKLKGDDLI